MTHPYPAADNQFLSAHIELLYRSYQHWLGKTLDGQEWQGASTAEQLFNAPFALLSHNTASDPILTYGNQTVLDLFELSWNELIAMPSRYTAEAPNREERAELLARVNRDGYISDYSGVRIATSGRRFRIEQATVWNLIDAQGVYRGQAAMFAEWANIK